MAGRVDAKLKSLGIVLPGVSTPVANYIPYTCTGTLVFVAGQICQVDGKPMCIGKVGADVDLKTAQNAARVCALNILGVLKAACGGDLDRVVRCLRLGGFVNAGPGFTDVPLVVNGASDLIVEIFGDAGRHARTAVGVAELPRNVSVEIDGIFEIIPP
jgi:enamine deaminase RidA (YjgF/YER057c/UK114 family)